MASGSVNFVNAGLVAEQMGIEVCETISLESGDYRNLIRLVVTEGDGNTFAVAGTVLDRKHPRIVQIGEFPISFTPEGKLAYVPHRNVPGVIGRVCTIHGRLRGEHLPNGHFERAQQRRQRLHHDPRARQRRAPGSH